MTRVMYYQDLFTALFCTFIFNTLVYPVFNYSGLGEAQTKSWLIFLADTNLGTHRLNPLPLLCLYSGPP